MSQQSSPEVLKFHHRIRLVINFEYSLHPDRIVVTGSTRDVSRMESTFFLNNLSDIPSNIWVRSQNLHVVIILMVLTFLASASILPRFGYTPSLLLVGTAVVVTWIFRSRMLVQYAQFSTLQGTTVFSVGDAGPDREQFDSFVKELTDRIRTAHATE